MHRCASQGTNAPKYRRRLRRGRSHPAHYHGTGALNINACRIGTGEGGERTGEASAARRYTERGATNFAARPGPRGGDARGRWPSNVILDEAAADALDAAAGIRPSNGPGTGVRNVTGYTGGGHKTSLIAYGDSGFASRFFFVPKASPDERSFKSNVRHPTIKPLALMQYFCRLVTPPGGVILDPFLGSGTTAEAAESLGFRWVGYEAQPEYLELIAERTAQPSLFGGAA